MQSRNNPLASLHWLQRAASMSAENGKPECEGDALLIASRAALNERGMRIMKISSQTNIKAYGPAPQLRRRMRKRVTVVDVAWLHGSAHK
jgi:hypothetical protein